MSADIIGVMVRFSPDQKARVDALAAVAGDPLATYIRAAALGASFRPTSAIAIPPDGETTVLSLRVPTALRDHVREHAKMCRLTPSAYVRRVLAGSQPKAAPGFMTEELLRLLNRIGNNLNQLAHRLNSEAYRDFVGAPSAQAVADQVVDVRAFLQRVVARVAAEQTGGEG